MRFLATDYVLGYVGGGHDHRLSLYDIVEQPANNVPSNSNPEQVEVAMPTAPVSVATPIDRLSTGANIFYVIFSGDPVINYTIDPDHEDDERERLLSIVDNTTIVSCDAPTPYQVRITTNFDRPLNVWYTPNMDWVSTLSTYTMDTAEKPTILGRFVVDNSIEITEAKYCTLDGTVNVASNTNKLLAINGTCNINGVVVERFAGVVTGPVTLTGTNVNVFMVEFDGTL